MTIFEKNKHLHEGKTEGVLEKNSVVFKVRLVNTSLSDHDDLILRTLY